MRVGINGFGRTGRQLMRAWWERRRDDFEVVAINGRTPVEMHTHLLRYDSDYGRFPAEITDGEDAFAIDGHAVCVFQDSDPATIDWGSLGVEVVVESTGAFRDRDSAARHLRDGVKKVIISAPGKGEDWMVILGVNHEQYDPASHHVISAGSCTTNCVVPVVKVLHDEFGIERALMTTIHSYTRDQNLVDAKHKDLRRARAAALNIIPTSTGAASAVTKVIPELEGKAERHRLPRADAHRLRRRPRHRPLADGLGGRDQRGFPGRRLRPAGGHPLRRVGGAGLERFQEPPGLRDLRPARDAVGDCRRPR